MSEYGDLVQAKCDAFADRVVKLNDYLLDQAANKKPEVLKKTVNGKPLFKKPIPVFLQAVANICNQLLRAGTSIGANMNEAQHPQSDSDFLSKASIALKESRESETWLHMLSDNGYLDQRMSESILHDCERINKILITMTSKVRKRLNT